MKRPRVDERRKATLAMRVPEGLHEKVKRTAERNGRSITQELEKRLQASFSRDDDGEKTDKFIELIKSVISSSEADSGSYWLDDHSTWMKVRQGVLHAVEQREPSDSQQSRLTLLKSDMRQMAQMIDSLHGSASNLDRKQKDSIEKLWRQKTRFIDKFDETLAGGQDGDGA